VSSDITTQLIDRNIRARQETRRGTVLSEPKLLNYDTAAIDRTVYVVDVDIGASRPLRDVVVKSSSGQGGRAYAQVGKAVEVSRSEGGRWFTTGASDRIRNAGRAQELDEATDSFAAAAPQGFTAVRRPYNYYAVNGTYGQAGYGDTILVDADGTEVTL